MGEVSKMNGPPLESLKVTDVERAEFQGVGMPFCAVPVSMRAMERTNPHYRFAECSHHLFFRVCSNNGLMENPCYGGVWWDNYPCWIRSEFPHKLFSYIFDGQLDSFHPDSDVGKIGDLDVQLEWGNSRLFQIYQVKDDLSSRSPHPVGDESLCACSDSDKERENSHDPITRSQPDVRQVDRSASDKMDVVHCPEHSAAG